MKQPILYLLIVFLGASCVPKKKYDELMGTKRGLQQELSKLKKALRDCEEMQVAKTALEADHEALQGTYATEQQKVSNLEAEVADLTQKYDDLVRRNEDILTSSSEEIKLLAQQLGEKEAQLDAKERELQKLAQQLTQQQDDLAQLQSELSAREARITELNDQLSSQQRSLSQLKDRLSNALLGFSDADLSVTQKDGKIYVSLSQNLLFGKDSYKIDAAGRDAIKKVAGVLSAQDDVSILVEGHTDSDGTADHNWDLSVKRATAVVKLLTTSGLQPERVTAAGRAYFAPVADNDSEANKSKNRRTEIILTPDLEEIFKLIETAQ